MLQMWVCLVFFFFTKINAKENQTENFVFKVDRTKMSLAQYKLKQANANKSFVSSQLSTLKISTNASEEFIKAVKKSIDRSNKGNECLQSANDWDGVDTCIQSLQSF